MAEVSSRLNVYPEILRGQGKCETTVEVQDKCRRKSYVPERIRSRDEVM